MNTFMVRSVLLDEYDAEILYVGSESDFIQARKDSAVIAHSRELLEALETIMSYAQDLDFSDRDYFENLIARSKGYIRGSGNGE